MTAARHAEIVGAGPGGLAAAAALAQRGWSVRVHERMAEPRAVGSGFAILENGLRVLEALGAYERATAGVYRGYVRETRDSADRVTSRMVQDLGRGFRMFEMTREHLMRALLDTAREAGCEVVTGSTAIAADPAGALTLSDGRRLEADLVIAADGVHSRLRDSLGVPVRRRWLADGAIRVVLERRPDEVESEDGNKTIEWWSGTRRVLRVPCSRSELYVALTALDSDEAAKALPVRVDVWSRSFPALRGLFERIGDAGRWDRFMVIGMPHWSNGRVAILGDAAHAMAPNLGQGGACAMMSALGLAVALDEAPDVPTALALWEKRERPLIDHTQRLSTFYSALTTWPGPLRSTVFWLSANWRWMAQQRTRAICHVPTGTVVSHEAQHA